MFDTQKILHDRGIMDVIGILAANGESGRLQIQKGATEGALFFRNGQLVDARVGDLTGFQAINAVASMQEAHFSFDASVVPPSFSSITPNERVVLKQFFGIEAVDSKQTLDDQDYQQDQPVISAEPVIFPEADDVTLETPKIPSEALRSPSPYTLSSNSVYRGGLILAVLFIVIAVAAVALRNEYRERALPASATAKAQPVAPAVAGEVQTNNPPGVKTNSSTDSMVQPVVAQNLTGKWNVVNTVQKTSYKSFQNLKIGFDLSINQDGNSFTGKGEKVSENGRSLPASSRTPIQVKGSINGDRVEATFFEEGTLRKTNGRFVWRINKAGGGLTGTFVSNAARATGKSAATRNL